MKKVYMLMILILFITGCASQTMQLKVRGSSVLNPDKNYHSLPVKITIYQLKQKDKFNQADFYGLWRNPYQWLGNDLVEQQSALISPGETKTIEINLHKKTQYIGVVGIFRKPGEDHWRVIKTVKENLPLTHNQIIISLVSNRIYLREH